VAAGRARMFGVSRRAWGAVGITTVVLACVLAALNLARRDHPPAPSDQKATGSAPAAYVGRAACAACHDVQNTAWTASDHDRAMQVADESTVLGDFRETTFAYSGVTSTFFTRDGRFMVRTDGPDGELRDYPIAYTFGVDPLQQYLIELLDGHVQALSIAWDSRSREEGGQRWFHLHPEGRVDFQDVLHWTGVAQNWNSMCAECHSTDVRKNYDAATDRYETTWSEIDVSCEACHGPGSRHIAWAQEAPIDSTSATRETLGLVVGLADRDDAVWNIDSTSGLASRSVPRESRTEIELCARCHSRRGTVSEDYVHGQPLMDTHRPALLTDSLYFSDGQIRDEVFVYGSFLQSKMYQEGVTCSDCHDAHSLTVRGEGNSRCATCHLPTRFDTPEHHFHEPDSAGASCVECHMRSTTYMVVDSRRDHSFRSPRPDLTNTLGTPNACNQCHTDESPEWATDAVSKWYGSDKPSHYGETLDAGRRGEPGAGSALAALAGDIELPAIVRATAVAALERFPGAEALRAIESAVRADDPMVRLGAILALETIQPAGRWSFLAPLLGDPMRVVRLEAGRSLAAVPEEQLTSAQRLALDPALEEYRVSQLLNADRAEAHANLGVLLTGRNELEAAVTAFTTAISRNPFFVPAYVNLADVYRAQNLDVETERVLTQGLQRIPDGGDLHHALGLLRIRQRRLPEALVALQRAANLMPDRARYVYVFAVALNSAGRVREALEELSRAHERHPGDREILVALATVNRDNGAIETAMDYARKLVALKPNEPQAQQLLTQLEAMIR
jgi:tetratricopeptide (TPR) repeat protein